MKRKLYFVNTGDDLIEGVFDQDGTLLDSWSPNDACWRSEYFSPFMERLSFELYDIYEEDDWRVILLRRHAMEQWGLTEEEAGLID